MKKNDCYGEINRLQYEVKLLTEDRDWFRMAFKRLVDEQEAVCKILGGYTYSELTSLAKSTVTREAALTAERDQLVARMRELEAASCWRRVEDTLPENKELVLVTYTDGGFTLMHYYPPFPKPVTHWMRISPPSDAAPDGETAGITPPDMYQQIRQERERQDQKWGGNRRLPGLLWLGVLVEEVGEVAKDLIEARDPANELIQVAAVVVAWLEDIERRAAQEAKN